MNSKQFTVYVFSRLPKIPSEDASIIEQSVIQMHANEWTVDDAVAYCRCLEEIDPELDEDIALARMSKIRDKYAGTFLL